MRVEFEGMVRLGTELTMNSFKAFCPSADKVVILGTRKAWQWSTAQSSFLEVLQSFLGYPAVPVHPF